MYYILYGVVMSYLGMHWHDVTVLGGSGGFGVRLYGLLPIGSNKEI
jgi:hypothetical protein